MSDLVLLVLDNCEHVLSAVADLAEDLTARLRRLHVLATSREPLWAVDEVNHRLLPLEVVDRGASRADIEASPAVRLSLERAAVRAATSLDTGRAVELVGEICRRVDGLAAVQRHRKLLRRVLKAELADRYGTKV